jgi:hypothetical protein
MLTHVPYKSIGDHTPFTKATFVIGRQVNDQLENEYPKTPTSDVPTSSVPVDRTCFLETTEFNTSIGPFPRAMDYLGDGSMYLIDASGRMAS